MSILYVGNGFDISEENGKYEISWEQGVFGKTVHYEISKENAYRAMKSDEDAYAVKIYAETGGWPSTNDQQIEQEKAFIRKFPKVLLTNPEKQNLFCKEEAAELLKKAKSNE